MTLPVILAVAALVFGVCYLIDTSFTKLFRSKSQHMSGMAVRASKNYGVFGVALSVLGVFGIIVGCTGSVGLALVGVVVLAMGACMAVYYLSFGIFYDGESFLYSSFGKKSIVHSYRDIREQKLYVLQGGAIIVELHMADGSTVSVQSTMDGAYTFLDTAFAGWCLQKGIDPQSCDFHDPSKHWWFPHEEEA